RSTNICRVGPFGRPWSTGTAIRPQENDRSRSPPGCWLICGLISFVQSDSARWGGGPAGVLGTLADPDRLARGGGRAGEPEPPASSPVASPAAVPGPHRLCLTARLRARSAPRCQLLGAALVPLRGPPACGVVSAGDWAGGPAVLARCRARCSLARHRARCGAR